MLILWSVGRLQVEEELLAARQDLHQASPRGIVLLVLLQMDSQLGNPRGQAGDLDLRRPTVGGTPLEGRDPAQVSALAAVASTAWEVWGAGLEQNNLRAPIPCVSWQSRKSDARYSRTCEC